MNLRTLTDSEVVSLWEASHDPAVAVELANRGIDLIDGSNTISAEVTAKLAAAISDLRAAKAKTETLNIVAGDLAVEIEDIMDTLQELSDRDEY